MKICTIVNELQGILNVYGIPEKKTLRIFQKNWMKFSKTVFEF